MSRGGFVGLVAAVVAVAFGATWLVSAAPNGANQPAAKAMLGAPLAPANSGRLQCYGPNLEKRTCQSLAGYATSAGGVIDNTATVLVSTAPLVTMQTVTPVAIKADRVCGAVREQDIISATFAVDGDPATPDQSAKLRKAMIAAMGHLLGREVCTAYVPEGDAFIATASIDGTPQPRFNQRVIWVSPSEGFTIGP